MSLINKMLQDLDARGGAAPGQGDMPQMRPVAQVERTPRTVIAIGAGLAFVLAAGGAWLGWHYTHRAAPVATVANMAAVAPALAPSVAPALAPSVSATAAQPALQLAAAIPAPTVAQAAPQAATPSVYAHGQQRSAKAEPRKRRRAEQRSAASPSNGQAVRGNDSGGVTMTSQQQAENAYRRGLAALQEGRVQEAIASMEQAIFLYPRHDSARQTLIGLLLENKRNEDAVRHLQLGLSLDVKQPQMAMLLARLQIETGGPAIETLQRTLPYARGNADYLAFLAGALQRAQNHRDAAEQYQAALRLQPQNGVWWMGLGISLQADKHHAEALEAFNRAKASGNLSQELQAFVERRLQQLAR